MKRNILFIFFLIIFSISCRQNSEGRIMIGEQNAREEIKVTINSKEYKPFYDTLIKIKETAIAVAEPILFSIYGKENIMNQKPYEIYMIDGYWYIAGTLPKESKGGVFEIIISSKDGQVVKLVHGK